MQINVLAVSSNFVGKFECYLLSVMLSSISVKENHRIGSNSSEVAPEQALNGVVGADLRPNETMNEDEEVDINGDDDEVANAWALQPIKNRLQDIPLSSLDEKCLSTLRKKLDIDRPEGRNYLELASRLFPEKSYDSLLYDVRKMPSPTSYLVRKLCKEKGQQATVFTLVEALFGMGRFDAIQDILRSFESNGYSIRIVTFLSLLWNVLQITRKSWLV